MSLCLIPPQSAGLMVTIRDILRTRGLMPPEGGTLADLKKNCKKFQLGADSVQLLCELFPQAPIPSTKRATFWVMPFGIESQPDLTRNLAKSMMTTVIGIEGTEEMPIWKAGVLQTGPRRRLRLNELVFVTQTAEEELHLHQFEPMAA